MVWHNLETNRLDIEWPPREVTRGKRSKSFLVNNSVQICRTESRQFIQFFNYSKHDYGRTVLTVLKTNRGQRSAGSGNNEIDYNSRKCNFRLTSYWSCMYAKWPALAEVCALRLLPVKRNANALTAGVALGPTGGEPGGPWSLVTTHCGLPGSVDFPPACHDCEAGAGETDDTGGTRGAWTLVVGEVVVSPASFSSSSSLSCFFGNSFMFVTGRSLLIFSFIVLAPTAIPTTVITNKQTNSRWEPDSWAGGTQPLKTFYCCDLWSLTFDPQTIAS